MKAIGLTKYLPINNPESLVDLQVATPEPTDRDLLGNALLVEVDFRSQPFARAMSFWAVANCRLRCAVSIASENCPVWA